jgi:methyl coenzyme M reductase subunit C-like uncharacterized protein (methanogenesis marker protein 7)
MKSEIEIPVSLGELLDKISILEIKSEKIKSEDKLENIRHELRLLLKKFDETGLSGGEISNLQAELKRANLDIWNAEDVIRDFDRNKDFGENFISTARSIYRLNDARARIKREINILLGSNIVEEKGYSAY